MLARVGVGHTIAASDSIFARIVVFLEETVSVAGFPHPRFAPCKTSGFSERQKKECAFVEGTSVTALEG